MNKGRNYLFVLFLAGLIYISCKKEVVYPPPTPPPTDIITATSEGGTFSYTPRTIKFSRDTLSIYSTYVTGAGSGCDGGTYYISFLVYAKQAGTYVLSNHNIASLGEYGFCSPNSFQWQTDSAHTGSINFTQFDTINHIVSGTFSFVAEEELPIRFGGTDTATGNINKVTW
jgi:hypothetical protein